MYADSMSLTEDLKEQTNHGNRSFPIQYYMDELYKFNKMSVPLHWHSELEFFVAIGGSVQVQVQDCQIILRSGDGIFLNSGILHSFQQASDKERCQCPNVVFSKELLGTEVSAINQKYIIPIVMDETLPYIIFTKKEMWQSEILDHLDAAFSLLQRYGKSGAYDPFPLLDFNHKNITSLCYEMKVQSILSEIWQIIYTNREHITKTPMKKSHQISLIRIQKMLSFIQKNYAKPLTLNEIAASANIAKSEASRCFQKYTNDSPVSYLIRYRIEQSKHLLAEPLHSVSQVSAECGFQSVSYFVKLFHKETGMTPSKYRNQQ